MDGLTPLSRTNQDLKIANEKDQAFDQVQDAIKSAITDLKEEVMVFSQGIKKSKAVEQPNVDKTISEKAQELNENQQVQQQQMIEESDQKQQNLEFSAKGRPTGHEASETVGEFAAAILQDTNIKKMDKKTRAKLEEKLELLASLEEDFKGMDFTPEQKEMIEEFFDKMARMKNLKNRLHQLEILEKHHEEQEKEQKRQQEQDEEQKKKKEGGTPPAPSLLKRGDDNSVQGIKPVPIKIDPYQGV